MITKQLLTELGDQLKDNSSGAATKQLRWLNMALQRVAFDFDFPQLRRRAELSILADTIDYVMPADVLILAPDNIMTIPGSGTDEGIIAKVSHYQLRLVRPGLENETGRNQPNMYAEQEWAGAEAQPSAASVIAVSSPATEANLIVTIEGIVGGEIDRENVTLDGATPSANTTKFFTTIHAISKSGISVGIITLTSNSAAVTNAKLGRFHFTKQYINIRLAPVPRSNITANYDYIPWMPELQNDTDIPRIPERFHEAILNRGLMYGFMFNSETNYRIAAAHYQDMLEFARRETGRDQGLVQAWQFGGDIDLAVSHPLNFDSFIRRVFWGRAYGGW